jgi:hypothetical protein
LRIDIFRFRGRVDVFQQIILFCCCPRQIRYFPVRRVNNPAGLDDWRKPLAMPISWRGTLQQYVGRLHRLNENKKEVQVFDYADVQVPMLARMYKKRLAGYAALGYSVANN